MKTALFASTFIAAALPLMAAEDPYGSQTFTGKVIETMNAATYTYVCVDTGKATNWAAAQQFAVKVGDIIDNIYRVEQVGGVGDLARHRRPATGVGQMFASQVDVVGGTHQQDAR